MTSGTVRKDMDFCFVRLFDLKSASPDLLLSRWNACSVDLCSCNWLGFFCLFPFDEGLCLKLLLILKHFSVNFSIHLWIHSAATIVSYCITTTLIWFRSSWPFCHVGRDSSWSNSTLRLSTPPGSWCIHPPLWRFPVLLSASGLYVL